MEKAYKLLINGRLVDGAATMPVINPATGEPFVDAPRADIGQLNEAVAAAKSAFPEWSKRPITERRELLIALSNALEERVPEFAALLTREQGKPLAQATMECMGCVFVIRGMASFDLSPKVLREDESMRAIEYRSPLGVVAAITPWNFPLILLINKVAPALLAGNTLVIKPAPTTPLTTLLLGEIFASLFPRGVINVIADQNDLGAALTHHPDIAKIAFTGSTATGRKVMSAAAGTIKRVTLELGGNDAALVLEDADLQETARKVFDGAMLNAGQICIAIKRVYVHESMYDAFCDELARLANDLVVGDGSELATQLGPIQNKAQYEKLQQLLDDARENGTVIAGGNVLSRPGYFIAPTIVRDVDDDALIVREEQFGPILPVLKYTDINGAIERINNSEYGLGGTVWGRDVSKAASIAERVNSGTVWVNKHMDIAADLPFRGAKQSGLGAELGLAGLEEYTQARVINVALTGC
ncbi:aldehyde dehydrogenase family protein [Massilia cavernae]|uniref:Aldehyde dehydrogenase n=1 Tax=Massilia cavernae TaxID=2320864 RepID=A0A418Y782_9BURK|nr:aldehyde dehydrogenase family protein [Massilia cavernae]RJG24714.1 aldehyde dehydrogenase family protein [Massilia cavernae]